MFTSYGEIDSIRVLHERFCAFVNFKNANMASRAMEKLNVSETLMIFQYTYFYIFVCKTFVKLSSQGHFIENTRLVIRYPDRRIQRVLPTPAIEQPAGAAG